MKTLKPGMRVRYIGQKGIPKQIVLLALYGRTGVIRSVSGDPRFDWDVEMDEGAYDIDAKSEALEPIEENDADCWDAEPAYDEDAACSHRSNGD